ncbi:hypothetical protein FBR06_06105, partial [Betaproteobacteria bacterium PRO4]|nr:hypothetical protein [Betaproteobacteria bacterium PRO4]
MSQITGLFPLQISDSLPWLFYWRGMASMPADPQTATLNLEQAYAGFDKTGNKTGCFLTLGALIEAGFSQANPVH